MTTTSELLLKADQLRPRSQQRQIGMSDLGSCRRRVGYKLANTEPVNPTSSVQAVMGSAIHDMVAAVMNSVAQPGDLVEHEVTFAGILGHLDRYEAADTKVVDTKTTSSRWLEHLKLHGPEHGQVWQISGYAAALIRGGLPVSTIQLDFLARDTGEEWVWSKPFNPQDVRDALEWLKLIRETPVDMLPRDHEPDSVFCRGCPFGGEDGGICWANHVAGKPLLTARFVDDPDAAAWAQRLWDARQAKRAASDVEARAKGALLAIFDQETTPAQCGEHWLMLTTNRQLKFVSGPRNVDMSA